MTQSEILLASRYAAAELAGALLFGKYASSTKNDYLRKKLIAQCSEEANHAWWWTEMLVEKNPPLLEVGEETEYFNCPVSLQNELELLAWAYVYELRADFHLRLHAQIPKINQDLKKTIEKINRAEENHFDWISTYLEKLGKENNKEIKRYFEKWGNIENRTYLELVKKLITSNDDYLCKLGEIIEKNLPHYALSWKKFLLTQPYSTKEGQ